VTLGRPSITHGIAVELPNNILDDKVWPINWEYFTSIHGSQGIRG
jgi:hypothetical protein